ncbi:MAG: zinc-binding dehydrogenase [Planctomycetota bacterium]
MKAVVIREHGGLDKLLLEDLPRPQPAADEVLVEIKAVGLNHLDTWVRRGLPGHRFPLPLIPGCDFSGIVREVGSAARGVAVGDRVLAAPGISCGHCQACASGQDSLCRDYGILGETCHGGAAEYATLRSVNAVPIPASLDFVQAAAFPLTFLTAWHMLISRCQLRAGETVLVHAAGSGVGSAAVQIAKLFHAQVIATAGSEAKLAAARALGADEVLNYSSTDWVAEVRRLTGKRGVDVVFEHVGADTFAGSLKVLAKGGRVVTCGATTGGQVTVELVPLFFKSQSILGSTMGSRGELLHIVDLVGRGLLKPIVDRVLPLERVREAHEAMSKREQFGKIVLVPGKVG